MELFSSGAQNSRSVLEIITLQSRWSVFILITRTIRFAAGLGTVHMDNRDLIKNNLAIVHRLAADNGDPRCSISSIRHFYEIRDTNTSESIDVIVPMTPQSALEAFVG